MWSEPKHQAGGSLAESDLIRQGQSSASQGAELHCATLGSATVVCSRSLQLMFALQVPKVRWQECEACQRRMAVEGLENEAALQSWFVRRIGDWLHARGRQLVGWDEILEGGIEGLTSDAVVMSWRVRCSHRRIDLHSPALRLNNIACIYLV